MSCSDRVQRPTFISKRRHDTNITSIHTIRSRRPTKQGSRAQGGLGESETAHRTDRPYGGANSSWGQRKAVQNVSFFKGGAAFGSGGPAHRQDKRPLLLKMG